LPENDQVKIPETKQSMGAELPSGAGNDAPPDALLHALRGRSMARNTIWQVVGQLLPLFIAAVSIPLLLKCIGVDRFGVLTLAWALVGYFSLFDLGLGRALTKVVSDRLAAGKNHEVAAASWTALSMMAAVGLIFTVAIWLRCEWIARSLMKVPPALLGETMRSLYPLALSIPVITVTTGLRGILEAQHRFGMVNVVRAVMGAFSFLGPLTAAFFSPSLFPLIAVLVVGRIVAAAVHLVLCLHTTPSLKEGFFFDRGVLRELMSTGSWITVSNLVGPLMVYTDRFVISALLSVSVVAYYTTPFELVTKLWLVPTAIAGVLFPAFAALAVIDRSKLERTYSRGVRACFLLLMPVVFLVFLFAPEGLHLWLGPVFAAKSTVILRWLAVGVLINSLGQVPYVLLQAVNRPDIPGKIHLVEIPLYLGAMVLGIKQFGLAGAAAVWAMRLILETAALAFFARKTLVPHALTLRFVAILALTVAALYLCQFETGLAVKLVTAVAGIAAFVAASWWWVLDDEERGFVKPSFLWLRS
jgi:O-antigen/teichoic acid export membrane protein